MSKARKEALFNHFSANLALLRPQYSNVFACPLCLRLFGNINKLDDAHIFPKRLGGRKTTLTCRDCNNTIGSAIESQEAERVKYLKSEKDRARLAVEGVEGDVGVDFWISHDSEGTPTLNHQIVDGVSNPRVATQIEQMFKSGQVVDKQVTLRHQANFNPEKARFTYLHFGFLYLFHNFGYAWALNPISEKIRSQLANPTQKIYEPPIWELPDITTTEEGDDDIIPLVVSRPYEKIGFLIATPKLSYEGRKRLYVWFPATPEGSASPPKQPGVIRITKIKETHPQLDKPGAESIVRNTLLSVLRQTESI